MRVNIRLKNIIILTIAGLINAFGVTVFLAPVKLYDSGISGTSIVVERYHIFSRGFFIPCCL